MQEKVEGAGSSEFQYVGTRPVRFDVRTQLAALRDAIEAAPKSTRWKLRSKIGDRQQWYVEPEEVGHS